MKKGIILGLFAAVVFFSTQSCDKEQLVKSTKGQDIQPELSATLWFTILTNLPPIDIDITFGQRVLVIGSDGEQVPTTCTGSGLCDVSISVGGINNNGDGDNMTTGGLMGFEQETLYLSISNADLQNEGITELDASTIFLAAPLTLDDELASTLGLPVSYTIESGDYEIASKDGRVFVKLN